MFNQFNTNEVQAAYTAADGTGQQQFETLTQIQAPGLGCGEIESSGRPQLLAGHRAPRQYEPNGFNAIGSVAGVHVAAQRLQLGQADPGPPWLRTADAQLPAQHSPGRDGRDPGGLPGRDLLGDGAEPDRELHPGLLLHGDDRERGHR